MVLLINKHAVLMMTKRLYDTNIIIDFLNGTPYAKDCVESCTDRALSIISVIEILFGIPESQERLVHHWLHQDFKVFTIDESLTLKTVQIRKEFKKLKLPDSLILATARAYDYTLVTRDGKDFSSSQNVEIITF